MSIYYKDLLVVDKLNRTARKMTFEKGINLITSTPNSVGKSSLALMMLYGFGAKVKFSDKWNLDNIFTKLTLLNDDREIVIIRYKDTYSIIVDSERYSFPIQKYGYADKLYELLGLTIKIKDKNANSFSTAIPSLYLLPYYLSQTKTDDVRSIFEDLKMYSLNDLYDAIYYHVGALDNNYNHVIQQLTIAQIKYDDLIKEKNKFLYEIEYLNNKLEGSKNTKIIEQDENLDTDIKIYKNYADKNLELYNLTKAEADIKYKIKLLNKTLSDNMTYTSKLLNEEKIACPICKSDITDFISSALTIGLAESDITSEIADLKSELLILQRKIVAEKRKLDFLKEEITKIESNRNNVLITRSILVWNEELLKIKVMFSETQLQLDNLNQEIKQLKKQLKEYTEMKNRVDIKYREAYASLLQETNINKKHLNFESISLYKSFSLGGSEIPRLAISRFFALLECKSQNSIVMPIIFDFPNLDMTTDNLHKCFEIICDRIIDTNTYPQSFVFSIDCLQRILDSGKSITNANVINMDDLPVDDTNFPQLLCEYDFNNNLSEINVILD